MTELWQQSAVELSRLFESKQASPREVLEAVQARLGTVNPLLNAVIATNWEAAFKEARASEERLMRAERLGPLDGVPLTVKDNLYVSGFPATWGSKLFDDFRPELDDIPVARLRLAGAIIFGKTNTPEFALAPVTENLLFGKTRNPWNTNLTPGGSSGGAAAAVAAGMGSIALATDGGGSIRRPASYTGLVGLKPSIGQVARAHGFPSVASDLQVIGPLARTVADAELLFDCIRGASNLGRGGEPPRPQSALVIRCLTPPEGHAVDRAVREAVNEAAGLLRELGHVVEAGPAPYDLAEIEDIWATLISVGLARVLIPKDGWREAVMPASSALCERGLAVSGVRYVETLDRVARLRERIAQTMAGTDLLLSGTSASLPWLIDRPYPDSIDGHVAGPRGAAIFATFVNAAGLPALSLPGRPSEDGLPVGLQLVASFGADAFLLEVAGEIETAFCRPSRWPSLFDHGHSLPDRETRRRHPA